MFVPEKERKYFYDWYFRANLDENYDAYRRTFIDTEATSGILLDFRFS